MLPRRTQPPEQVHTEFAPFVLLLLACQSARLYMHRLFSGSPEALAPLLQALSHIPRFGEANEEEEGLDWLRPLYEGRAEPKISPFILASNIPPVPAKLVKKIQALEYVNMRDLLQDNIALGERLEALPRTASSSLQHSQREVDTILT